MTGQQLLVVEDEVKISQVLCDYLERAGYAVSCLRRGDEVLPRERTIDTHIKNLRKKIASLIPDQELVSTVYGVGYKLSDAEE
jgi:two-component system response regulator BaeR